MKKLLILSIVFLPAISFAQNNDDNPYQPKFIGARGEEFITIEKKRQKLLEKKQAEGKPINLQNALTIQEKYNNQLPENLAKKLEEEKIKDTNKVTPETPKIPNNTKKDLNTDIKKTQDNTVKKASGN